MKDIGFYIFTLGWVICLTGMLIQRHATAPLKFSSEKSAWVSSERPADSSLEYKRPTEIDGDRGFYFDNQGRQVYWEHYK